MSTYLYLRAVAGYSQAFVCVYYKTRHKSEENIPVLAYSFLSRRPSDTDQNGGK